MNRRSPPLQGGLVFLTGLSCYNGWRSREAIDLEKGALRPRGDYHYWAEKEGEGFFQRVYDLVAQIPYGKVATYGQIALYLGYPKAARTVGWALHALPEGREVPWHRVINGQGRVSTSRLTHSADLQRAMLEEEGVVFDGRGVVDFALYRWETTDGWPEGGG
jgi:methylated-DNA-protein-cysteine methyltransferase-like protein